jgi:C_GCAxxG_C_C family probable redox protein
MPENKIVLLKEAFAKEAQERAYAYEYNFRGCCQGILLTFQELLGMEDELTFKAAGFLSAGVAICQKTCGALLGGQMVLGMKYGRSRLEEGPAPLFEKLEYAQKLVSNFERKFGSTECRDISGIDFSDKEAFDEWRAGPGREKSSQIVGKTARLVAEILYEIKESGL